MAKSENLIEDIIAQIYSIPDNFTESSLQKVSFLCKITKVVCNSRTETRLRAYFDLFPSLVRKCESSLFKPCLVTNLADCLLEIRATSCDSELIELLLELGEMPFRLVIDCVRDLEASSSQISEYCRLLESILETALENTQISTSVRILLTEDQFLKSLSLLSMSIQAADSLLEAINEL